MNRPGIRASRPAELTTAELWAEIADQALVIAREIQSRGYADERAVSLTPTEGMVMRHLINHGDTAPTHIAAAVGLQRTNLSIALKGLQRKGFVDRHLVPTDARRAVISATDRGRANYANARQEWASLLSSGDTPSPADLAITRAVLAAAAERLVSDRPGNGQAVR